MDKLSAYKLDNAYTGGVELTLDNAPDVIFMVRLPSMYNRAYTQALYSGMHMEVNDDGTVTGDTNIMDAKYAQEDAFVAHCLVSIDGEPLSKSFADDYPAALAELMEKATALATSIDRAPHLAAELEDHESARVILCRRSVLADQDRLVARQRDHVFGIGKRADGPRVALRLTIGDRTGRERRSAGECP